MYLRRCSASDFNKCLSTSGACRKELEHEKKVDILTKEIFDDKKDNSGFHKIIMKLLYRYGSL